MRGTDRYRFLRSPEAKIAPAWADALVKTAPEDTLVSRVFSGRCRSIATTYARAATAAEAPAPAPYPIQQGLTAGMRGLGTKENNIDRIQAWAGQSAALAAAEPASAIVERSWTGAQALLACLSRNHPPGPPGERRSAHRASRWA